MLVYRGAAGYRLPGFQGIAPGAYWTPALVRTAARRPGRLYRLGGLGAATPGAASLVSSAAAVYGVDPGLALAVANQESGLNQSLVSGAGAVGVMQLMPATAAQYGANPSSLTQNIDAGVHYLADLLQKFGGNVSLALAAYNAGPGKVQQYGGVPPFPETQNYVSSILSSWGGAPAASPDSAVAAVPAESSNMAIGIDDTGASSAGFDWTTAALAASGVALLWVILA